MKVKDTVRENARAPVKYFLVCLPAYELHMLGGMALCNLACVTERGDSSQETLTYSGMCEGRSGASLS